MHTKELRNPNCVRCKLSQGVNTVCLMGEGNQHADLMFVGEGPGADEDRSGHPFVGQAGQILNNILREYEIKRSDVYISNSVKCRPTENRRPHVKEIKACRPYLLKEIRIVKPKIIVALGQVAMATLLNTQTFTISAGRGKVYYAPWKATKGIPIIVTYHPAAVKRDNSLIESVFTDFEYFLGILKNGITPRKDCTYRHGVSQFSNVLSIDLETTGLNAFFKGSNVICIGSTDRIFTGYCTKEFSKIIPALSDPKILKIGHNIKFDIKWLKTHGLPFEGQIHDTLVAEHMINENLPSYGLKELAATYTDMGAYSAEFETQMKLNGNDPTKVPIKTLMRYCAEDVDAAMRLYERQVKRLEEEGLNNLFDLTMYGELVMADAEIHGVNVDKERHAYLRQVYKRKIKKYRLKIKKICGKDLANPDSGVQLGKVLVGKLGFPVLRRTKKGRVSVDKVALDKLSRLDKTGIINLILKYRKLRGDYSKYLSSNRVIWQEDGKVHCDFRISGTDTGRYSCVKPNLQQVPRESQIKSMFISSFDGGKIIQIDYDQGELRLLAQYSGDRSLVRAFQDGVDIHTQTAHELYKIPIEEVTEKQRYDAKQLNFSIIYGMGAESFAVKTKMKVQDAKDFMQAYRDSKPGIQQYIREMGNQVIEKGYVENLFGRKRRIPIIDLNNIEEVRFAQRRAVNAPIQSALHDLNVLSMVRLYDWLKSHGAKSKIILAVHDSVVLDAHPKEIDKLVQVAKEIFESPETTVYGFELSVPMTVSIGIGDNWKEASGK